MFYIDKMYIYIIHSTCSTSLNNPESPISDAHICVVTWPLMRECEKFEWSEPQIKLILPPLVTINCQSLLFQVWGSMSSFLAMLEFWMTWYCAGHQSWLEFMSTIAMPWPEDSISQPSSTSSYLLTFFLPLLPQSFLSLRQREGGGLIKMSPLDLSTSETF